MLEAAWLDDVHMHDAISSADPHLRLVDSPPPIDEAREFVATLLATPADTPTACPGWTVHELVAHLAAGAAEEADLIESHLGGLPERPTRGFGEREAPYRALDDTTLRDRLFTESLRLAAAIGRLGTETVAFTGRSMTAADFALHTRSECALHRWDIVGRDDVGWAMLAQPELARHAVSVLTSMPSLREALGARLDVASGPSARVVVRSAPDDDLVLDVADGSLRASWALPAGPADVECEPAQRLLLLWGRHEPSSPLTIDASEDSCVLVDRLVRTARP